MKWWLLFWVQILVASDYAIVFVHLGPTLPTYTPLSLAQARLFNPDCPIYLIAHTEALSHFSYPSISAIPAESLATSSEHAQFIRSKKVTGYWQYVIERFYYLEELMSQYQLKNVFHLENDVMLYRDLRELLPVFEKNYPGMIGGTFDCDERCIAGFMYVSEAAPLSEFVQFASSKMYTGENDMFLLGLFRKGGYKKTIDHLPIIPPSYGLQNPLESYEGSIPKNPGDYSNHFEEFDSLFDAAAFGQYLGGIDPIHGSSEPGFINESALFNPAYFNVVWQRDEQGRQVPFASYQGKSCPINNLHIHSKNLQAFSSFQSDAIQSVQAPPALKKTTYPLSTEPIDVVIYATESNRYTLDLCIEGIQKYGKNTRRIVVISEAPLTDKAEWFDAKRFPFQREAILDTLFRTAPFEKRRYAFHPRNQLAQIQSLLARLYAPFVIPDLSSNVLIIEPDVFFLAPVDFANEQGGALFNPRGKCAATHKAFALRLFPELIYGPFRQIEHYALLQRPILEELFEQLRKQSQEEPWQVICRKMDPSKLYESTFSDLSLYGNFALLHTDQVQVKPLKWTCCSNFYFLEKYEKEGYIYVRYLAPGQRPK